MGADILNLGVRQTVRR